MREGTQETCGRFQGPALGLAAPHRVPGATTVQHEGPSRWASRAGSFLPGGSLPAE